MTMMIRKAIIGGLILGLVSACSDPDQLVPFDGHIFRTKLSKVDKQRDQFSVTINQVSASLKGAREAGRYEATGYCIEQFGSSDVDWVVGPDSPDSALVIVDDKLTLRGACVG
jgi:hypothetical protein